MKRVKITLTAIVMFAIIFTLNACGGDDNNNDNGGVDFNENSQIYYEDGSAYKGNGTIKLNGLIAGSVTNGVVSLRLPEITSDVGIYYPMHNEEVCTISDHSAKVSEHVGFALYNGDEKVGSLGTYYFVEVPERILEKMNYVYASKAVNINCFFEEMDGFTVRSNFKYVKGWNKEYTVVYNRIEECSTDNILTKELKWTLSRDN
jgi:hypothetical protein